VGGAHVDKYHNLMHLAWGASALGVSFLGTRVAMRFCIASGAFYLTLATLGLTIGNPAMSRAWYFGPMLLHTGDHIFHLVLGSIFLAVGLVSGRQWIRHPSQA
jgi:heme/copper-type cytochrome/quinol oxidase subunit 3